MLSSPGGAEHGGLAVLRDRLSKLYEWLAWTAARRWVSLILIAGILIVDLGSGWHGFGFVMRGLLDEPCHQATGLICLGAITRFRGSPPPAKFGWSMIIWSNAIDLDHLPAQFGYWALTNGTPRPYTHALWTVVVLALAALAARYWPRRRARGRGYATAALTLFGAACGVADHFLRDIATAPMSFWWPITDAAIEAPYWCYVVAITVIALIPVAFRRRASGVAPAQPERPAANAADAKLSRL